MELLRPTQANEDAQVGESAREPMVCSAPFRRRMALIADHGQHEGLRVREVAHFLEISARRVAGLAGTGDDVARVRPMADAPAFLTARPMLVLKLGCPRYLCPDIGFAFLQSGHRDTP